MVYLAAACERPASAACAPPPSACAPICAPSRRRRGSCSCSTRARPAWRTRLALENAELIRGVRFEDHPRVREVVAAPGTALLYPGPGSVPAGEVPSPPAHLVVIDGTWLQADRMLRDNPSLAALPRVGLAHDRESGYAGLRREPAPGHLSTIEAVALALGALERDPARFAPMGEAFRRAVRLQVECTRTRRNPRHRPRTQG